MGRTLFVALLASALVVPGAMTSATTLHKTYPHKVAKPGGIGVVVDQARMVTLERPAKTMYIGNPTIADINIVDARHAFVLGKTFGVTNLIALDADGRQISNQQVTVMNGIQAVTFNQGGGQYNYSCTRVHCEAAPRPGDVPPYVSNTETGISTHEDAASKSASGGSTGTAAIPVQ
ncbi:MAG: pilus assembly protein N-terminal domain-containing protein [Rhizomicrobium sp.]|jgi:hypothetical protein